MFAAGPAVARYIRMTRSYSFRTVARRVVRVIRPVRDPSIRPVSFTCFRLVPIGDPEPGESAYAPIELCQPPTLMSAFIRSA